MPREFSIPAKTVHEEILSVEHQVGRFVRVLVGRGSTSEGIFQFEAGQVFEAVDIRDAPAVQGDLGAILTPAMLDYTELMSADPIWARGKPAGVFRHSDLWIFIDRIRNRNALSQ